MYAYIVCIWPLLGEEGPGNEARNYIHVASDHVEPNVYEVGTSPLEFFHDCQEISKNTSYCIMSGLPVSTVVLQ